MQKPRYHNVKGSVNVESLIKKLLSLCAFVLTSYTDSGRKSTVIDQTLDRFIVAQGGKVNKKRKAALVDAGKLDADAPLPKEQRVNSYQTIKGIFNGDDEFECTQFEVIQLVNKMLKQAGEGQFVQGEDADAIFWAVIERYVNHEDATKYITLEDLKGEELLSLDPPKSGSGSKNAGQVQTTKTQPNGVTATV